MFVALAGGVGGAKLARGLADLLTPENLMVVVNTGDDFEHLGLSISPDIDTVMYTLAGLNNPVTGWGLAGETWQFMEALALLGGETWFKLGDRDLATHVERTWRLRSGESLTRVTRSQCKRLGVRHRVVPMTDDPLRTFVRTEIGRLSFQDYFVRHQCRPAVTAIEFDGEDKAEPNVGVLDALGDDRLAAIVICPSNPFLSIMPILALAGMRKALDECAAPIIAVSPIIGGRAIKGPAADVMRRLGHVPSAKGVAQIYGALLDGLVIDEEDARLAGEIAALGLKVKVTDTIMRDATGSARLAADVIAFACEVQHSGGKRHAP